MSESITNIRIRMENAKVANEAVKVIKSLYEDENIDAKYAEYLIKDLKINDSEVMVENSIILSSK